jgi:MFS family permease
MNAWCNAQNRQTGVPRGIYHGWRVVGAAFLVALFAWGLGFYGPGVYLLALQDLYGWSSAAIAAPITAYYLLGATLVLFAGAIFERFGTRWVVATGTAAMACGVMLLALVSRPWQLYAAFMVMSAGWASMSGAAINIIVAPWFDNRRGLAVSLALNGASAGGLIIAPLLILLIDWLGFAAALDCAAVLMLVVLVPTVTLVMRPRRPDQHDRAERAPPPEQARSATAAMTEGPPWKLSTILHSRNFHSINLAFALGLMAQVGFLTHQVSYLSPIIGTLAAGWAVSLTTFSAIVGRIAMGSFVDHVDRRVAACGNFAIQIAGIALLASSSSAALLYLGCALFGLAVGNMITLPGLIVQREFPKQHFARIVSLIVAITQFTFAFGPGLLGYIQRERGYTAALVTCLLMQATAATIVILPVLGRISQRTPAGSR